MDTSFRSLGWRLYIATVVVTSSLALGACAVVGSNQPHNKPGSNDPVTPVGTAVEGAKQRQNVTDVVALSFSGGGLRAAAFSLGALEGLSSLPGTSGNKLLSQVQFVTAVSGGSLTAAWIGLNGVDSLGQFRRTALLRAGKHELDSSVIDSTRLLLTGNGLADWLDAEIFHTATFADMAAPSRPLVWINATNLNQRLPFVFNQSTFDALCSDLGTYPVSDAVAASMAVPLVFSPVTFEKHPNHCTTPLSAPDSSHAPIPEATMLTSAINAAALDYRDVETGRYLKLADGGLTDNLGVSSVEQVRLMTNSQLAPLTHDQAMSMHRLLFVVVDSGRRPVLGWTRVVSGPTGFDAAFASVDAAIDTNMRLSYDRFLSTNKRWRDDIAAWRCAQPESEQRRQRALRASWRCDDVEVSVTRISFDDLGPERARTLNEVPTTLTLPPDSVESAIQAGRDAMRQDKVVLDFSAAASVEPM